MSRTESPNAHRLVTHPREHFLRQNETRIRSLAAAQHRVDPMVNLHLSAVHMAEDLQDIHESAATAYQARSNSQHRVEMHTVHRDQSQQFKLYHLDKLAIILI